MRHVAQLLGVVRSTLYASLNRSPAKHSDTRFRTTQSAENRADTACPTNGRFLTSPSLRALRDSAAPVDAPAPAAGGGVSGETVVVLLTFV